MKIKCSQVITLLLKKKEETLILSFKPELTPKEMLELGVFGGRYMRDCKNEFPDNWFDNAKFAEDKKDISLNFFKVDASLPLSEWQKGWIYPDDPRGLVSVVLSIFFWKKDS